MNNSRELNLLQAFSEQPPPLDFVLPGMLTKSVGAIVSPGGMGKSFFAMQLSINLAGGPDLLDIGELKKGKVLYLPAEDPLEAIRHRLFSLKKSLNMDQIEEINTNLRVRSYFSEAPSLLDNRTCEEIKNMADGVRLIIIDTLRRFHKEDENASGPMTDVISRMETICYEAGCSLLFLHHSTKSSSAYGADKPQSSRGSGVLVDNIRWQGQLISLTKKDCARIGVDEDRAENFVKFKVTKQNYGRPVPEKIFERGKDGVLCPINFAQQGYY